MSDRYELATEGIHQAELATVSETTVRIKGEEVDGVLFTWLMLDQRDSRNKPLKLFDRYPLKSQRLKQRLRELGVSVPPPAGFTLRSLQETDG